MRTPSVAGTLRKAAAGLFFVLLALGSSCGDDGGGRSTVTGAATGLFTGGSITWPIIAYTATPYPALLPVTGMTGPISNFKVRVNGLSAPSLHRVSIALYDPSRTVLCFMHNARVIAESASNVDLVFDPAASTVIGPGTVSSGTYKPDCSASAFANVPANGQWELHVWQNGDGGGSIASWSLEFTSTAPNRAPVNAAPTGVLTVADDGVLAFTGGNSISFTDQDVLDNNTSGMDANGSQLEVRLSVGHGALNFDNNGAGLSILDALGDGSIGVRGSHDALNAALAGLTYRPTADVLGTDSLTIITNDLGGANPASPEQDVDTVEIEVTGCIGTNSTGNDDNDDVCNDRDHRPIVTAGTFSGVAGSCTAGGIVIHSGVDEDASGNLQQASRDIVYADQHVCNGATGEAGPRGAAGNMGVSMVYESVSTAPQCANGGITLRVAEDTDDNRIFDATLDQQLTESQICFGLDSAVRIDTNAAQCPNGGVRVYVGTDDDGNGALDVGEEDLPSVDVCNGLDALVASLPYAVGSPECPAGGARIRVGTDADGSNALEQGEYVEHRLCNGTNALTRIDAVPALPSSLCPAGGQLISVGNDDNGDGMLQLTGLISGGSSSSSSSTGEEDSQALICNGLSAVTRTLPIPAQDADCPAGGTLLLVGIDDNGSGMLDLPELDGFHRLCNGIQSAVLLHPLFNDPSMCPNGGMRILSGFDADGDGQLEQGEEQLTENICHGLNSLVGTMPLPIGHGDCPAGGIEFSVGTDANGNGFLDGNEGQSRVLCNGRDSLMAVTQAAADPLGCPTGGQTIAVGLDDNGNGTLDNNVALLLPDNNLAIVTIQLVSEVDATATVCNGLNSLTRTTPIPAQSADCPEGGVRLDVGIDDNGNGALEPAESDGFQVLCSAIRSAVRLAALPSDTTVCAAGGVRLDTGFDTDGNGALDEGEENAGANICHGLNAVVMSEPIAQGDGTCPAGGQRFRVGTDANNDGVLAGGEVARINVLCNGRDVVTAVTPLPADPAVCPAGGRLISLGTDLDANGTLDLPGERSATATVCSGSAAVSRVTTVPRDPQACAEGGVELRFGIDANGNGTLDPGEGESTQVVCSGSSSGIRLVELSADPSVCPNGGVRVESGIDRNGDSTLAADEVYGGQNVCGTAGALTRTVLLAPDVGTCSAGGTRLESGTDTNGNRELDDNEVTRSSTICRATGVAVRTEVLAKGSEQCQQGGKLVRSGVDKNADGTLQDDEVTGTDAICEELPLLYDAVAVTGMESECPFGGERVRFGHDDGRNGGIANDGVLQAGEIGTTRDICYATSDNSGTVNIDETCSLSSNSPQRALWMLIGVTLLLRRQRRRSC